VIWRVLVNAVALWAATELVDGIRFDGAWPTLLAVALVFGVLNVTVRPILKFVTFPLLILTLGLFTFVLNALMLWLTGAISDAFAVRVDHGAHVASPLCPSPLTARDAADPRDRQAPTARDDA
jgi:uncharacterized membrane protein YvlD (DUF360 family)